MRLNPCTTLNYDLVVSGTLNTKTDAVSSLVQEKRKESNKRSIKMTKKPPITTDILKILTALLLHATSRIVKISVMATFDSVQWQDCGQLKSKGCDKILSLKMS